MLQNPHELVTAEQWRVAQPWLAQRATERRHLSMYLSGAHAYGFPSPDSDLDIKCVHIANTAQLLALTPHDNNRELTEIVDGVELDYSSHEVGMVLRGVISGNGNYIERFLGSEQFAVDPIWFAPARMVVTDLLSQRVANHYMGFATSQLKLYDAKPTAKRALYVLRTTATGCELLTEGRMVTNLRELPLYWPSGITELFDIKQRSEREPLPTDVAQRWRDALVQAIAAIEQAKAVSPLPVTSNPTALQAANDWLISVRRSNFS